MTDVTTIIIIALLVINLVGLLAIGARVSSQQREARNQDKRLTKIESRVDHQPSHSDLREMSRAMNAMAETVATIKGQTLTMMQMLRTVQEHLLENDR